MINPKRNSKSTPEPTPKPKRKRKYKVKFKRKPKPATHAFIEDIRNQPPRLFYSIKAVCVALSLGRTSVFALLAQKELDSVVYGRRRLVYAQSVIEYGARLKKDGGAA
jgi:hypothetical protein